MGRRAYHFGPVHINKTSLDSLHGPRRTKFPTPPRFLDHLRNPVPRPTSHLTPHLTSQGLRAPVLPASTISWQSTAPPKRPQARAQYLLFLPLALARPNLTFSTSCPTSSRDSCKDDIFCLLLTSSSPASLLSSFSRLSITSYNLPPICVRSSASTVSRSDFCFDPPTPRVRLHRILTSSYQMRMPQSPIITAIWSFAFEHLLTCSFSRSGRLPDRQLLLGGMFLVFVRYPHIAESTVENDLSKRYSKTINLGTPTRRKQANRQRPIALLPRARYPGKLPTRLRFHSVQHANVQLSPARWILDRGAQGCRPGPWLQHLLLRDWYDLDLTKLPRHLFSTVLTKRNVSRPGQVRPPCHLLRS